jgi:hypothetical protein
MPIDKTICKFVCDTVTKHQSGMEKVKLDAQYDQSLPEDRTFAKASPSGSFEVYVSNSNVHGFFVPGQAYYLEISPATTK